MKYFQMNMGFWPKRLEKIRKINRDEKKKFGQMGQNQNVSEWAVVYQKGAIKRPN